MVAMTGPQNTEPAAPARRVLVAEDEALIRLDLEKARDAGAMAYLVKPFSKTDLVPAIEVAVSRFGELTALEKEVQTLADRLETRKLVERAKGVLQSTQGLTEPEAFKWIQRAAMDRRTTMKRVAEVVLETLDTDAPS